MSNFIFSINATIPIFLVILLGWFLMKIHLITEEFANVANKYVFKVALPVLLFRDIATTSILDDLNIKFVLFCFFGTIIMFGLVWLFALVYCKDRSMVGAFVLMIVAAVPMYNVISVIALTFGGNDRQRGTAGIKKAFINILKNPIIIGIVLGVPFSVFDIPIPAIPLRTIGYIAQTATPIALIAIGAGFDSQQAITRLKPSLIATVIKLVILPIIFLPAAIWMGFDSSEIVAILIMVGAPATVSGYIMAKNMDNDYVLSSNIIVISTLLSSVTLTMWVFVLKCVGAI